MGLFKVFWMYVCSMLVLLISFVAFMLMDVSLFVVLELVVDKL